MRRESRKGNEHVLRWENEERQNDKKRHVSLVELTVKWEMRKGAFKAPPFSRSNPTPARTPRAPGRSRRFISTGNGLSGTRTVVWYVSSGHTILQYWVIAYRHAYLRHTTSVPGST
eukprot:1925087-Rhodomonas_salina.2